MALISVDRAGVGCTRPWQMMPFEAWSDCKLGCVGLCAGLECGLSGAGTAYDIDRDRVWRWPGIVLPSSVVATFCRRLCGWGGRRTFFERPGAMICYVFRRRCCRDTLTFLSFGYEVTGDYNISLQFLHVLRLY